MSFVYSHIQTKVVSLISAILKQTNYFLVSYKILVRPCEFLTASLRNGPNCKKVGEQVVVEKIVKYGKICKNIFIIFIYFNYFHIFSSLAIFIIDRELAKRSLMLLFCCMFFCLLYALF